MQRSGNKRQQFEYFVAKIQEYLDSVVIDGSDQELFIASYLSGHFSLIVSRAELEKNWDLDSLNQQMLENLNAVFLQHELPENEQKQVYTLWKKLIKPPGVTTS